MDTPPGADAELPTPDELVTVPLVARSGSGLSGSGPTATSVGGQVADVGASAGMASVAGSESNVNGAWPDTVVGCASACAASAAAVAACLSCISATEM